MGLRDKYPGSVVTDVPVTPTEDNASGVWTLKQQAENQSKGTWPFVGDPNFKENVVLLHGDTSQTPSNQDRSASNHGITIGGSSKATNWSPFSLPEGYWSRYINAYNDKSDYHGNITLGSDDFTIGMWVHPTGYDGVERALADHVTLYASGADELILAHSQFLSHYNGSGWNISINYSTDIVINTWQWIQVDKTGNLYRVSIDGSYVDGGGQSASDSFGAFTNGIFGHRAGQKDYLGYMSNFVFIIGANRGTIDPPTTPIVANANTDIITYQSNRFVNNGNANLTFTVNTNLTTNNKTSTFSPFTYTPTATVNNYGSFYFSGVQADYLYASYPYMNTDVMGTGDFTWECWVYPSGYTDYSTMIDTRTNPPGGSSTGMGLIFSTGTLTPVAATTATNLTSSIKCVKNAWNHVALTRLGTTLEIWVNGSSGGSVTNSSNLTDTRLWIAGHGQASFGGSALDGFLSNIRIIKGKALYTSDFTPPTKLTELTLVEGENSVYMDGSGDQISVPSDTVFDIGTSDFSIEFAFYSTASLADKYFISQSNSAGNSYPFIVRTNSSSVLQLLITNNVSTQSVGTGTTTLVAGRWYWVQVIRTGATEVKLYLNGTEELTTTLSNSTIVSSTDPIHIGAAEFSSSPITGYTSNVRFRVGNKSSVTSFPTSPLSNEPGTVLLACASRFFEDKSVYNHSVEKRYGEAVILGDNPFNEGYWSNGFLASGERLSMAASSDFQFGTGDFTVELWVKYTNASGDKAMIDFRPTNGSYSDAFGFTITGTALKIYDNTNRALGGTVSTNIWTHLVLQRVSGVLYAHVDGTATGTTVAYTTNLGNASTQCTIGSTTGSNTARFDGHISNVRVVKGSAIYGTGNFTVSTAPFTTTSQGATASEVKLLTCQSNRFIDNSSTGHSITVVGTTSIKEDIPFELLKRQTKFLNLQNNQSVSNSSIGNSTAFKTSFDPNGTKPCQGTFSPFSGEIGKWSNHFVNQGASGDFLNIPYSSELQLGTGEFTIEHFVYLNSTGTSGFFGNYGDNSTGWYWQYIGGELELALGASAVIEEAWSPNVNQWYHLAVTRDSSNNIRIFVDGTQLGSAVTSTTNFQHASNALQIGNIGPGYTRNFAGGYISNVRIIKGTALYTSNFTAPTKPFETPTVNGEQSVYFDGNGDYLIANADSKLEFDNNQFSVEWWENRPSVQSFDIALQLSEGGDTYSMLFGYNRQVLYASSAASSWDVLNNWNMYGSYTSKYGLNKWTHICVTRDSSGQIRAFIDGVMTNNTNIGASTNIYQEENAVCFASGQGYSQNHSANIYISNARICIGSIPTDYQTSSTTNGTTIFTPSTDAFTTTSQGASNVKLLALRSKIFSDDSDNPTSMTAYNQTEIRYSNPFNEGYWSLNFDGTNDNITVPNSTNTNIGGFTEDYTLECWFKLSSITSNPRVLFGMSNGPNNQPKWLIGINMNSSATYTANKVGVYSGSGGTPGDGTYTPGFTAGTWYHFRLVYTHSNTTLKIYINGTEVVSNSGNVVSSNGAFTIGTDGEFNGDFIGNISNVRIVKGTALGSTVPTEPLTAIANTTLLTAQSSRYVDNSSNGLAITVNNDTNISEDIPFQLLSRQTKLLTCQSNRFKDEANNRTITTTGTPKVFPYAPFAPSRSYSKDVVGGSAYFDATTGTGFTSVENVPGCAFGSGDFTVEVWVYNLNGGVNGQIVSNRDTGGSGNANQWSLEFWSATSPRTLEWHDGLTAGILTATGVYPNQWSHITVARSGTTSKMFVNGVEKSSVTDNRNYSNAKRLNIGDEINFTGASPFNGYIGPLRILKGTCLYKNDFTPPTAPFTEITNTEILINFTDGAVIDSTGKSNLEAEGNTGINANVGTSGAGKGQFKKYGNGSIYFDGASDVLTQNASPLTMNFGTGQFTFEFWALIPITTSTSDYRMFMSTEGGSWSAGAISWYTLYTSAVHTFPMYVHDYNASSPMLNAVDNLRDGKWHHHAVVRGASGACAYFVDGTRKSTATHTGNIGSSSRKAFFGGISTSSRNAEMYLDDLRITVGTARYDPSQTSVTIPTKAFKNR